MTVCWLRTCGSASKSHPTAITQPSCSRRSAPPARPSTPARSTSTASTGHPAGNTLGQYDVRAEITGPTGAPLYGSTGWRRALSLHGAADGTSRGFALLVGSGATAAAPNPTREARADADVMNVRHTLLTFGTKWAAERTTTLINTQVSEAAIETALNAIGLAMDADDQLLVFYAGEGDSGGLRLYSGQALAADELRVQVGLVRARRCRPHRDHQRAARRDVHRRGRQLHAEPNLRAGLTARPPGHGVGPVLPDRRHQHAVQPSPDLGARRRRRRGRRRGDHHGGAVRLHQPPHAPGKPVPDGARPGRGAVRQHAGGHAGAAGRYRPSLRSPWAGPPRTSACRVAPRSTSSGPTPMATPTRPSRWHATSTMCPSRGPSATRSCSTAASRSPRTRTGRATCTRGTRPVCPTGPIRSGP